MAEPFKNLINAALVRDAGRHLSRSTPDFGHAADAIEAALAPVEAGVGLRGWILSPAGESIARHGQAAHD